MINFKECYFHLKYAGIVKEIENQCYTTYDYDIWEKMFDERIRFFFDVKDREIIIITGKAPDYEQLCREEYYPDYVFLKKIQKMEKDCKDI